MQYFAVVVVVFVVDFVVLHIHSVLFWHVSREDEEWVAVGLDCCMDTDICVYGKRAALMVFALCMRWCEDEERFSLIPV